ncbi:MAG: hypothetical protein HY840_10005 [Bacteroidetes bacterium]|nr:hypothetical protein [Bacteroidota bacterium]
MKSLNISLLLVLIILSVRVSIAQDRQFARTYQSTVQAKGGFDIEFWNTMRTGRDYFYNRLDQRLEFEYGVTDKFQSAFYLNASHSAMGSKDTSFTGIMKESEFSFSNELKWQVLNPNVNRIGLGLYAEYTIGSSGGELEGKLILDKRNEKNIFAYNASGEYELNWDVRKGKTEVEKEFTFENNLGFIHLFKPTFGLGIEASNQNVFIDGKLQYAVVYAGPTLYLSSGNHYVMLNIFPQLTNLAGVDKPLELNDREKIQIRLFVGFSR